MQPGAEVRAPGGRAAAGVEGDRAAVCRGRPLVADLQRRSAEPAGRRGAHGQRRSPHRRGAHRRGARHPRRDRGRLLPDDRRARPGLAAEDLGAHRDVLPRRACSSTATTARTSTSPTTSTSSAGSARAPTRHAPSWRRTNPRARRFVSRSRRRSPSPTSRCARSTSRST